MSLLEGSSYLVLVGIAVPVKYWFGNPSLVHAMGSVHGGLFVLFLITLARVAVSEPWGWRRVLAAVGAAILPFGAFWFERRLRANQESDEPS